MEEFPKPGSGRPSVYESPLGSFEVQELQSITGKDIGEGDRAFIHTRSGNRYMLRHSRSQGEIIIYNEREGGFEAGTGHPFRLKSSNIATVGQPLEFLALASSSDQAGTVNTSTQVTRIEVRKGLEAAIQNTENSTSFGGIAQMLTNEVKGIRKPK